MHYVENIEVKVDCINIKQSKHVRQFKKQIGDFGRYSSFEVSKAVMSSGSRYRRPPNSSLFVRGLNLSTT